MVKANCFVLGGGSNHVKAGEVFNSSKVNFRGILPPLKKAVQANWNAVGASLPLS